MQKQLFVGVYGAASDAVDENFKRNGEWLGEKIAEKGWSIVYGGGSTGMMGAIARGCERKDGILVGVIPYFMTNLERVKLDCTKVIRIDSMAERKSVIEAIADVFLVLPGGIGTFDELFQALTQITLGRKHTEVIIFNDNHYYDDLITFMKSCTEKGFIRPDVIDYCHVYDTKEKTLEALEQLLEELPELVTINNMD